MTLKQLIDTLKGIAMTQPDVKTASDGDVYEKMNDNPTLKYSAFHVTQTTHQTEDGWDNYGLSLFVIDRLMDDNSNRLEVQSQAKETLNNIILTFCENYDAEHTVLTFTPFTQKFKDNCAGVWCNVTIGIQADYDCAVDYAGGSYYPSIVIIDNKDITITENGVYQVPEGYTGYGTVTVNLEMQDTKEYTVTDNGHYTIIPDDDYTAMNKVELDVDVFVPSIKDNDTLSLRAGDNGTYRPEGYDAVAQIEYDVLPNQDKDITIRDNGTYTITYDEGYSGLGQVEAVVDLPIQDTKMTTYNENGTYTITPDDDNIAFKAVTVNVEYSPRPSLPNGICLSGSTFTTLDMSQHDWSKVYDLYGMFKYCSALENIINVPSNFKPHSLADTFVWCSQLKEIPNFDTSNVVTMENTFENCGVKNIDNIKGWNTGNVLNFIKTFYDSYIEDIDLSQWDMSKAVTMSGMFYYSKSQQIKLNPNTPNLRDCYQMFSNCSNLTTVPYFDTSNVTNMSSMFYFCENLQNVPDFDTSNVINMSNMFGYCYNLTSVTLDLTNATNVSSMFRNCNRLTSVRFTGNPKNVTSQGDMFYTASATGTLYYPSEYDYSFILKAVPTTWTIIPY